MLQAAIDAVAACRSPDLLLNDTAQVESRGPIPLAGIGPTGEWESYWADSLHTLRRASPWAEDSDAARDSGPAGVPDSIPEPDELPEPHELPEPDTLSLA